MSENNTAYCLKQKLVKEMKDVIINKTKNNRRYMSGICVDCGCKMNKFLKKEIDNKEDDNKVDEVVKEDEVKKDDVNVKVDEVKDIIEKFEKKIKDVKRNKKKKEILVE